MGEKKSTKYVTQLGYKGNFLLDLCRSQKPNMHTNFQRKVWNSFLIIVYLMTFEDIFEVKVTVSFVKMGLYGHLKQ